MIYVRPVHRTFSATTWVKLGERNVLMRGRAYGNVVFVPLNDHQPICRGIMLASTESLHAMLVLLSLMRAALALAVACCGDRS